MGNMPPRLSPPLLLPFIIGLISLMLTMPLICRGGCRYCCCLDDDDDDGAWSDPGPPLLLLSPPVDEPPLGEFPFPPRPPPWPRLVFLAISTASSCNRCLSVDLSE